MNWNEFAKEVHQNAVDHGWWEEERTFGEIVSLCHSELSEALEEYRAKRPMMWFACCEVEKEHVCAPADVFECAMFGQEEVCAHRGNKPEGVAVELADCIIRILDWFGKENQDVEAWMENVRCRVLIDQAKFDRFGDTIAGLHANLSIAHMTSEENDEKKFYMAMTIVEILTWAKSECVSMEKILEVKHAYNKTRPYRHGGKVL